MLCDLALRLPQNKSVTQDPKSATELIVGAYDELQQLVNNGDVAGKEAGKARSVSNFLNTAIETESIYTAIAATTDASEVVDCYGNPGSVFSDVCLLIASALELLAEDHMNRAS